MRAEVLGGKATHERKVAICAGSASLSAEERVELLAVLAADSDPSIAERAAGALLTQPAESFQAALARPDAARPLFSYCAANLAERPGIADALAKNPGCPPEILLQVAQSLSTAGIQALVDDLDRLTAQPELPALLVACPAATVEQQQTLQEILRGNAKPAEFSEAVAEAVVDSAKRQTLLERLQKMRVVERIQLALKGGREERMALIRDPSKLVHRAVLQSPRLSEPEVETFASMATLTDETLRLISLNRKFMKNYVVLRNLVFNPKMPLDVTLRLMPRLLPKDLKLLAMAKNVPETLRASAEKLNRQRILAHQK